VGATYRLMDFVVQADVDDGLLLLNNMTKEMGLVVRISEIFAFVCSLP